MNQAIKYSDFDTQSVIPKPYAMGISGNTAIYESKGGKGKGKTRRLKKRRFSQKRSYRKSRRSQSK